MKRTISMILVAVMLVLSLVSCGYSIADEDISTYATLSQEDKANFEKALKNLLIEDGDFTTDPETKQNKINDALYAALAGTVTDDEQLKEGKAGAHDLVYYAYYCTAKFGDETVTLYASSMKTPVSVQMGLKDPTKLEEKLISKFADLDFKDKTYEAKTSGNTAKDDVAFVSYTYTYKQKNESGTESEVAKSVTNAIVVIGEALPDGKATSIGQQLSGKAIGSTLSNFEIEDEKLGAVKYTNVKINWVADGAELASFTDTTYDEKTTVTDTNGISRNLKDVELTYHIYPVGFISVPEYNATSVMNEILANSVSANVFYELVFGKDFVGAGDEDKKYTEEQKNEILDKYKDIAYKEIVEKLDNNVKSYVTEDKKADTLADFISAIAKTQNSYISAEDSFKKAENSLETAETALESAETAQKEAQKAYDDKVAKDGEAAATAEKETLDKAIAKVNTAKETLEGKKNEAGELVGGAKKALEEAKAAFERATDNRNYKISALFALDNGEMEKKIADGYSKSTELYLQEVYENEIKMNVAKEVFYFLRQNVKINAYPEKAIEATYEQLLQNYEYKFYNEDYGDTKVSNYKHYEKSFEKYFIATVANDLKLTLKTYEDAEKALRENAKTYVEPILVIYAAANAYGAVVTDEEYEEYKDELGAGYDNNLSAYGDNSFRYACQFDKLLNHLLEEGQVEPGEDEKVVYNKYITYYFDETREPASYVENAEDEEDEHAGHNH
jgi:hypothetical protein